MKNVLSLIVILLFLFSCQKKENIEVSSQKKESIKKDTLEFLFGNFIEVGRFHNQFGKILYSDSIFFISSALGESELYLKGKLISKKNILNYNSYDSIAKKYQLKEMDILKFTRPSLNYQFKDSSACTKVKSFNTKTLFHSVMKSKSGTVFQYVGYENENPILKICNSNTSYIFEIKNSEYDTLNNSYITLMDITGDGKDELFIFYDELSSITLSFDVYQINYFE